MVMGTGALLWEAGVVLAQYMTHTAMCAPDPEGVWKGKVVLELGSGTGVGGIAAALMGAQVTLTDLPGVLPLLAQNLESNVQEIQDAGGSAVCAPLDWGVPVEQQLSERNIDTILAADCLYNVDAIPPITAVIKDLFDNYCSKDPQLLWCHKRRHATVDAGVLEAWEQSSFSATQIDFTSNDAKKHGCCLYQVTPSNIK